MEFLGMIGIGILGLVACFRLFGIALGGMNHLFDNLSEKVTGKNKNAD